MADYGNETSRISDLIRQYRDEPLQDIGDVAEEEKSQDQSKRATDLSEYMDKYKTKMEEGGEEIGGGVLLEGGRKIYGRARTLYKKYKEATRNNQTKKEFKPKDEKSDPQAENEEPLENPEGFSEDTAPPKVGDVAREPVAEEPKIETIGEEEEGEEETDPFDPEVDTDPNQADLLSPQEQAKADFESAKSTAETDTSGEESLGRQASDSSANFGKSGAEPKSVAEEPQLETIGEEGALTEAEQQSSADDLFSQIENQSAFSEQRMYETRNDTQAPDVNPDEGVYDARDFGEGGKRTQPTSDDSGGDAGASAEADATDSTQVFGEGTSSGRVVGNPNRDASADTEKAIGDDVPEPEGYAPELFGAGGGSEADSIASRVGGSILDTFKSRGAGIFQKYQDAKNFIQKGASELGGDGASAGTTAGGEALGETAGVIGGEAVGGAVAGGVAEAVVGAIPVLGEIALVGVGLVKFGEAIYHLFHPKHDKAKVINSPQNVAMPTASQQLTSKYAQALPSIDTASDVSASVMSF